MKSSTTASLGRSLKLVYTCIIPLFIFVINYGVMTSTHAPKPNYEVHRDKLLLCTKTVIFFFNLRDVHVEGRGWSPVDHGKIKKMNEHVYLNNTRIGEHFTTPAAHYLCP